MRQLATTSADGAPPATSRLAISQRGEADRAKLEQALRAQGYFDGTVAAAVREPGEVASQGIADQLERLASPPQAVLVFDVTPGPRYQFGTLAIELTDNPAQWQAPPPKDLGLVVGGPALTQSVLDAEQKLLGDARKAGFALAKLGQRDVVVDHDTRKMDVTLHAEPGRRAVFGTVTFTGGDGVDPEFLRRRVPFAAGDSLRSGPRDRGSESAVRHQPVLDHRATAG